MSEQWISYASADAEIARALGQPVGFARKALERAIAEGVRVRLRDALRGDAKPYEGGFTWVDAEYDEQLRQVNFDDLRYWLAQQGSGAKRPEGESLKEKGVRWNDQIEGRPKGATMRSAAEMIAKQEDYDIATILREARSVRAGKAGKTPRT
jgi:hypothetical protein